MEKFCGQTVEKQWGVKSFWDKVFEDNMIIVCTAEILFRCLHHAYIQMERINLLIFDECHHAKKNHPYGRIIKDFYAPIENHSRRPRIFGMTASPVDAQTNVQLAAKELEGLLHSEIAKIAPADRPPVRPVRGSIVCDVSGSLITSSYVREGEIQALYSTYTFRMIDSVITSVYGIPCNNPSYERYPTSGSYTTDVYNTAG